MPRSGIGLLSRVLTEAAHSTAADKEAFLLCHSTLNNFTDNKLNIDNLPVGYSGSVSYESSTGSVILPVTLDDPAVDFPT